MRERYRYTYRTQQYVPKFDADGVTPKEDELVTANHKHLLVSRLKFEYSFKKIGLKPYVSCDLYNSLTQSFVIDKLRCTGGVTCKLARQHSIDVYYRYITLTNEEDKGHVIGVGYKFKL